MKLPPDVTDTLGGKSDKKLKDLSFMAPVVGKKTWDDRGEGFGEAKDVWLEDGADVTVAPGVILNGGKISIKRAKLKLDTCTTNWAGWAAAGDSEPSASAAATADVLSMGTSLEGKCPSLHNMVQSRRAGRAAEAWLSGGGAATSRRHRPSGRSRSCR